MKVAIVVSLASMITPTALASAQVTQSVAPEYRNVAVAALEWFLSRDNAPAASGERLVISRHTSARALLLRTGHDYTVSRTTPLDLQLRAGDLRRMVSMSSDVRTCEELSKATMSPCAIAGEWVWLVLDKPGIRGDRAVVLLQVLEPEYRGEDNKPVVSAEIWEIFLQREGGSWRVQRASIIGTS
jgi:hypothetical protein